jgi:hypothetical protein
MHQRDSGLRSGWPGVASMDAAGSPGDIGFAIVQIVDELY